MKIIRYLDNNDKIHYGARQEDGSALEIEGDIFGEYRASDRAVQVKKLLAPVAAPVILCIGLNYRLHATESGGSIPEFPMLFMKNSSAIQNPGDPITLPTHLKSEEVDYECELAVIIKKSCKNVSRANALDYVLGYTCANDVSARDWQLKYCGGQFCRGKSFDTFAPIGPYLVTTDEIPNPNTLGIKTILNGEVMQESNTEDMIFDVPTLVEFLSGSMTLTPGTVLLTGTPSGVGFARKPPVFLKEGDKITVAIEQIGELTNPVVDEK